MYIQHIKTFLFQKSWGRVFQSLSNEDAGLLIKALFQFADGESPELEDETLDGIFLVMADQIEESARNYVIKSGIDVEAC